MSMTSDIKSIIGLLIKKCSEVNRLRSLGSNEME